MDRIKPKIKLDSDITIRTFMIGTIQLIEDAFGDFWGINEDEMDEEDKEIYADFLVIRERILDMGNDLIKKNNTIKGRVKIYG